jgi:hypothetical protein
MLLIYIKSGTISLDDVRWGMGQTSKLEGVYISADDSELDKAVQHEATECEHLISMVGYTHAFVIRRYPFALRHKRAHCDNRREMCCLRLYQRPGTRKLLLVIRRSSSKHLSFGYRSGHVVRS